MRYRYILCGLLNENDEISKFRLIAGNKLKSLEYTDSAIRVKIPDDLILEKYSCDEYSTTVDNRTIKELGYDVLVKFNGKWRIYNKLKGVRPCDFYKSLMEENFFSVKNIGYVTRDVYRDMLNK